jgi:two-component system phosphate regulon sensor histidine kinase PhoR
VVIFRDITKEKELEETRKNLLSLASHQLRTPLSGTRWLIETLKKGLKGSFNKDQEEYLDEIYKINERMTELVHDMMGILRIEGDVTQVQKKLTSTDAVLNALLDTLEGAIKSKQIVLRLPENSNYMINTDPLILRNILESLVSNAINYSATGSEVIISIKKNSTQLVFSIKDFGIGIPKKEQRQIFERFYRASNAKTFDTNGTGLGLYITSMLAKKIGVLLSFESEEGVGTTFYVHVPYSVTEHGNTNEASV